MTEPVSELVAVHQTQDGRWLRVAIPDGATFDAIRDALDDPVWLLGATWELLTTNEFKRDRFHDAFGAWMARQDAEPATALLEGAGASVEPGQPPA